MAEDENKAAAGTSVNAPPKRTNKRRADDDGQDDLPQPYNANSLQPAKRRAVSPSEQPRKLKRPGARARISEAEREAIRLRQIERDRAAAAAEAAAAEQNRLRGVHDVVKQHYNSVPERGRDWRTRDSKIKGLRVFNNWIKSCIVQRYSPDEDHTPGSRELGRSSGKELLVLDIGCGKGGDLSKWQQAPQSIQLYVGLDPADVSIEQARERRRPPPRLFDARFHVKDCYGESIEDVDIIHQVGFDPSPMNRRGFDVVSMMFSMHYAFESEARARTMLRNVAGALKKGGRFIGCIPNSDVLGERVRQFNEKAAAKRTAQAKPAEQDGSSPADKTPPPTDEPEDGELEEGEAEPTAEWGNSIYRVRFPGKTPDDGVFRPAFGWKYNFFLDEAVEEVPEYVVPWEAFRALAEDFNLELQFHRTFPEIWEAEKDDAELGPLSERMGVRERGGGPLLVSDEEMEAASFYIGFCFYKV
ncbi:mRNA capping enzyme domain-containing protein [Hirsutella rhossiliensis]|uniref:mRNA cap guanine-N(7) methyltransferase n=1 Tax=Hirsutella rhossiliensis TaxID=111463 RepID=A0A9P8MV82_9HYPO|nr:mRNA capping enzyme domain-containing protein [Hirsutella rhossiliensis]KAH0961642.1 mRNA capping enzyme domain-containing protein [Hirsutella rhossiliensis]